MAEIIEKPREISQDHFLVRIRQEGVTGHPGQFINIRVNQGTDPLIRRPISLYNIEKDIIEIVIQVVGKGTRLLAESQPGALDLLGPLGKGFTMQQGGKALLVGGGVGNAPLYYLARELRKRGNEITYIYGSRSIEYMYLTDEFASVSSTFIMTTDDGSRGRKGYVTDTARELLATEKFDRVYTCGPTPMMAALVSIIPASIPVEVSLENYFGCGIGLCVGCTVETTEGFRRACIDGPVMEGRTIMWETLAH